MSPRLPLRFLPALAIGVAVAACANLKAALDEPCLRDDDCITKVCVAFICRSAPDLTDTAIPPTDAATGDATKADADAAPAPEDTDAGG